MGPPCTPASVLRVSLSRTEGPTGSGRCEAGKSPTSSSVSTDHPERVSWRKEGAQRADSPLAEQQLEKERGQPRGAPRLVSSAPGWPCTRSVISAQGLTLSASSSKAAAPGRPAWV